MTRLVTLHIFPNPRNYSLPGNTLSRRAILWCFLSGNQWFQTSWLPLHLGHAGNDQSAYFQNFLYHCLGWRKVLVGLQCMVRGRERDASISCSCGNLPSLHHTKGPWEDLGRGAIGRYSCDPQYCELFTMWGALVCGVGDCVSPHESGACSTCFEARGRW